MYSIGTGSSLEEGELWRKKYLPSGCLVLFQAKHHLFFFFFLVVAAMKQNLYKKKKQKKRKLKKKEKAVENLESLDLMVRMK